MRAQCGLVDVDDCKCSRDLRLYVLMMIMIIAMHVSLFLLPFLFANRRQVCLFCVVMMSIHSLQSSALRKQRLDISRDLLEISW
jgi:uncharacterized membrane protein